MEKIKISVIIPVYNQKEEYFKEAIESVINQTVKPHEIIVVDDGSEPSLGLNVLGAKEYYKGFPIKLITNEKNMGIGFSRKRGVDEATGDYIAFLSSDDVWDEKFLETMIKTAEQHLGKILYSKYYAINENSEITGSANVQGFDNHEDFCVACFDYAYKSNMFVNFSTTFFPKKIFEKVQFDKNLRFGEDLDFLLRSIKHLEYHLVPEYLLKYRAVNNLTSRIRNKIPENNKKIIKEAREYWENE